MKNGFTGLAFVGENAQCPRQGNKLGIEFAYVVCIYPKHNIISAHATVHVLFGQ